MSEMPKVGQPAPPITLQAAGGQEWSLAAQMGVRNVVLLFYVLDWTPG